MPETKDPTPAFETISSTQFINVKGPNYRSVYSNQSAFGSTAFDFNITFGEFVGANPATKEVTVEQQVRVVMSPLHFKIFVATCIQQLKLFEENLGPIPVPGGAEAIAQVGGKPVPIP